MKKITITNRKGQKVVVVVEQAKGAQKGLAFVMHGLGGWKEQPHIVAAGEEFSKQGYTVVRFDTTNTYGESDGQYEDATVTNYFADLEDVVELARGQEWFEEQFVLSGHSLGGICVVLYAEKYPERVRALAPMSSVISGSLSCQTKKYDNEGIKKWKETGWIEYRSSDTKRLKRLPWSHMEDRLQYDVLPEAGKLTMPVMIVVGTEDDSTPLEHEQMLYEALPEGNKTLRVIDGAPHTFLEEEHLVVLGKYFKEWIKGV